MFQDLKYNLYEILNVSPICTDTEIKNSYNKLIKQFHPDKSSTIELDIYKHIIIAKNILINPLLRSQYNQTLNPQNITFPKRAFELKNSFLVEQTHELPTPTKSILNDYNKINEDLNHKHNYNVNNFNSQINDVKTYNINDITIEKNESIKNTESFNEIFNQKYKDKSSFLIKYNGEPEEYNLTSNNDSFTELNNIDKLYIDETIDNTIYSRINNTFLL